MLGVTVESAKRNFFDRQAVMNAVGPAKHRALSKAGAFVRRRALSLVRTRKRASRPGEPPSAHTASSPATGAGTKGRSPLKAFLFFAYDPSSESAVIGPAEVNQRTSDEDGRPLDKGTVPEVLEQGGKIGILEEQIGENWYRLDRRVGSRKRGDRPTRFRTIKIAPRPFMQPAYVAEQPHILAVWANSVRARA